METDGIKQNEQILEIKRNVTGRVEYLVGYNTHLNTDCPIKLDKASSLIKSACLVGYKTFELIASRFEVFLCVKSKEFFS